MAVVTMPLDLLCGVDCSWGQQRYDLSCGSETTGGEQTRLMGPPRWTLKLVQPPLLRLPEAGRWQAMTVALRGRVNVLAAYDPVQSVPLGTLRGTLGLAAIHPAGATTLNLGGGNALGTLKAGDKLQVGTGLGTSQIVMVMADGTASASGVLSVPIEPPLRQQYAKFTPLTWDHPLAYFRRTGGAASWTYDKRGTTVRGISLDLLETWS